MKLASVWNDSRKTPGVRSVYGAARVLFPLQGRKVLPFYPARMREAGLSNRGFVRQSVSQ